MAVERLAYRPAEAAEALGISRARMYELLARHEVEAFKVGDSLRVTPDALRVYIAKKTAEHAPGGAAR